MAWDVCLTAGFQQCCTTLVGAARRLYTDKSTGSANARGRSKGQWFASAPGAYCQPISSYLRHPRYADGEFSEVGARRSFGAMVVLRSLNSPTSLVLPAIRRSLRGALVAAPEDAAAKARGFETWAAFEANKRATPTVAPKDNSAKLFAQDIPPVATGFGIPRSLGRNAR